MFKKFRISNLSEKEKQLRRFSMEELFADFTWKTPVMEPFLLKLQSQTREWSKNFWEFLRFLLSEEFSEIPSSYLFRDEKDTFSGKCIL